ncbi:hypothetical protein [Flaviflexus massiliensis]|uniref:hypothetical protein n=1 Tax=Flaviflexus massiliensis TaxID=1522309 RepID=UPI0006D56D56|nr:hypothetical protein [Flaviflexus massiliensis]
MQRYGSHAVVEAENWADGHVIQLTDDMIEDFMGNASIFRDMARDEVAGGPNSIEVFSEALNEAMTLDVEETIRNGGSLDDIAQTAARHVPLLHTSLMAETMTDVEIQEARDIRMRAIETVAGKVGGRFTEVPGAGSS